MKLKIKETYLLLIIVMGLVSLSVYSTYALFTASTTIDDVVSFNATLNTDNNLIEYEMITLSPGEVKMVEINVNNTYSTSLYYGAWYQIVSPSDTTDIVVGLTDDNTSSGSGAIAKTSSIKLIIGLANNSSKTAIINIGTVGSTTSNLNLPTGRNLIPEGFDPRIMSLIINMPDKFSVGNSIIDTTCSDANITFNPINMHYKVSSLTKKSNNICTPTFTNTSRTRLNDYIISLAGTTQGDGQVVNETVSFGNRLDSNSYTNVSNDTTYPFSWDAENRTWISTNRTITGTTSEIAFKVQSSGDYQICYKQPISGSDTSNNFGRIYKNGITVKSLQGFSGSTCYSIGELTTSDIIMVDYRIMIAPQSKYEYYVEFYLKKVSDTNSYRYEGQKPNNYIYFNNEIWRIIGVFDSSTHGINNAKLVKIVRSEPIGSYVWNTTLDNDWSNSSLYHLLNDYYYNATNGTSSEYCYQYFNSESRSVKGDCNYSKKGLQIDYRKMVQNVNWYSGVREHTDATASAFYTQERDIYSKMCSTSNTTTAGYVGLIYASDFGYSVLSSDCPKTKEITYSLNSSTCSRNLWLKNYKISTLTLGCSSDKQCITYVYNNLIVGCDTTFNNTSYQVLPTLYLKSDVLVIDGDGSISNPYKIGI